MTPWTRRGPIGCAEGDVATALIAPFLTNVVASIDGCPITDLKMV